MTAAHSIPAAPHLVALPRVGRTRTRRVERPDAIIAATCEQYGVTYEAVAGPQRGGQVGAARRALIRALRARTAMTLTEIGAVIRRDHTTVSYHLAGARNGRKS